MKNCDPLVFGPALAIESRPVHNEENWKRKQLKMYFLQALPIRSSSWPSHQWLGKPLNRKNASKEIYKLYKDRNSPGPSCLSLKFSSANLSPYIDSPPRPSPWVKSPPWIIKLGIILWNVLPLKWGGFPLFPAPFSPIIQRMNISRQL